MTDFWRLLDLGAINPHKSNVIAEGLFIARKRNLIPNTLCIRLPGRYVALGTNVSMSKRVNLKYCHKEEIPILREPGYSVIVFDGDILHCHLVCDEPHNLELFLSCVAKSLQLMSLEAYVKSNDVLVNGKKISGNSIDIKRDPFVVFGSTIVVDFDYDFCERALLPVPELFANKEAKSHREWVTTLRKELGREVPYGEVVSALREGYGAVLDVEFEVSNSLTDAEEQILEELQVKYQSEEWLKRGKWSPVKEY